MCTAYKEKKTTQEHNEITVKAAFINTIVISTS